MYYVLTNELDISNRLMRLKDKFLTKHRLQSELWITQTQHQRKTVYQYSLVNKSFNPLQA